MLGKRTTPLDRELRDVVESERARVRARQRSRVKPITASSPVDRESARWQRLRLACGTEAANNISLDQHCDHIWRTVEAFTQANGDGRTSLDGTSAATPTGGTS